MLEFQSGFGAGVGTISKSEREIGLGAVTTAQRLGRVHRQVWDRVPTLAGSQLAIAKPFAEFVAPEKNFTHRFAELAPVFVRHEIFAKHTVLKAAGDNSSERESQPEFFKRVPHARAERSTRCMGSLVKIGCWSLHSLARFPGKLHR